MFGLTLRRRTKNLGGTTANPTEALGAEARATIAVAKDALKNLEKAGGE